MARTLTAEMLEKMVVDVLTAKPLDDAYFATYEKRFTGLGVTSEGREYGLAYAQQQWELNGDQRANAVRAYRERRT